MNLTNYYNTNIIGHYPGDENSIQTTCTIEYLIDCGFPEKEILKIRDRVEKDGYSLVPLKLYLKNGRAKILIGIAKGKKNYDKRQSIKEKDIKRDLEKSKYRY